MKFFRFILSLPAVVFWACLAQAESPWGLLSYVAEDPVSFTYAVDNLIDKRPIRYAVEGKITPEEEKIFQENILKWPTETLRLIQKSGRTKEFADIVPILQHELVLQKVSEHDSPNIMLRFSEGLEEDVNGDFLSKDARQPFNEIRISKHAPDFAATCLHEIGHYFGLGDQYDSERKNSHVEYSSDVNYSEKSIMHGSHETQGKLTCDDADGLINLIDLRLAQRNNGRFSARAKNGWKSLCPGSTNLYQKAKTVNRREEDVLTHSDYIEHTYLREYKNGKFQQETHFSYLSPMEIFDVPNDAVIERDPKTNLIQTIYTVKQVDITLPDGTTSRVDVPYKRHFTYYNPVQREGKEIVEITLEETLNGKPLPVRFLGISSDGETERPYAHLRSSDYFTSTEDVTIGVYFADGFIHPSYIEYYVRDDKRGITLQGKRGENTATVTHNEQTQQISIPPIDDSDWYLLWGLMEINMQAIASYYHNFYRPLFGTNSAQQEQAREQVKQALSSPR